MSLLSLLFGNYSNNKATSAANAANDKAMGTIGSYYDDAKGYMQPYMGMGQNAVGGVNQYLNGDYSGFYNSPDYKAALAGGADMLDRSAASRGMLFSGAHQKDLSNFGQQQAAQYMGNHRNWLTDVAGMGQQSATDLGRLGMGAGENIANLQTHNGINTANKYMNRAKSYNDFESSIFKLMGKG